METIDNDELVIKKAVTKMGRPLPQANAIGGWTLGAVSAGGRGMRVAGVLNSTADAYAAIAKQPLMVPKAKPLMLPRIVGARVGYDAAIDQLTTLLSLAELNRVRREQREEDMDEDLELVKQLQLAAAAAGARGRTVVKQKTFRKNPRARVRVHGYSRRHGFITKDFKRRSPRRR